MEKNFVLRMNGGHRPSILSGRLIVVVSEWDKMLAVVENFKIQQLWLQARLSCLDGFSIVPIDFMAACWRKILLSGCSLDSLLRKPYISCRSLLLSTSILNDYILWWSHTSKEFQGVYLRIYTCAQVGMYHICLTCIMLIWGTF